MSVASPSILKALLREIDKKPCKSLSQNFLIDQNIIDMIVKSACLTPQDTVLEIGPGMGALTQSLLKTNATVIAVEKDNRLVPYLRKQFCSEKLSVIQGDILTLNLQNLFIKNKKIKVISSLPYQVTSQILDKFCPLHENISSLTFIMQKEVAERIQEPPNSKAYSFLSVFTHFYAHCQTLFNISPSCFFPKPNVHSSVLQLTLKQPPIKNHEEFIHFVKTGFSQRRKQLSSLLGGDSKLIQDQIEQLGLSRYARAENLDVKDWMQLFTSCTHHSPLGIDLTQ